MSNPRHEYCNKSLGNVSRTNKFNYKNKGWVIVTKNPKS